eukprot:5796548-Pleurochrysis_carterae.AAC.1
MHKASKHKCVVGNVLSSHRGRVEDASGELEVRPALLDRVVGLGFCNAELAESAAYPLGFVVEPSKCSGDGEVVDPNDDEEGRAVALEGEDARLAPKLREA